MSSEETATSETPEASPAEESQQREQSPEGTDWRAESTRLRQQLKKAQDLNRQSMPYVQTALALQSTPGGDVIIDKLQKGEPLTETQEKKLEKAKEDTGTSGISEEKLGELLNTAAANFEQRLFESNRAKDALGDLHVWAAKEFPGYEDFRTSPEWNQKLGTILDAIKNGSIQVPEDSPDPYKFALRQAMGWMKGLDPEIGKEKPSKKTETERREAISQSSIQAGGVAPEDSDKLPDYARLDIAPRGVTGGGRSFSSLKRT